jgi:hypothetical protein
MTDRAKSHTDPGIVDKCLDPSFFALCLVKSGFDNELCSDVTDACEVAELNALDLAVLEDVEEAASKLFLVKDEARYICKMTEGREVLTTLASSIFKPPFVVGNPLASPLPPTQKAAQGVCPPVCSRGCQLWRGRGRWGIQ